MNAIFRPAKGEVKSNARLIWESIHKGIGWMLVLAALINCTLPLSWVDGGLLVTAAVLYAAGLAFVMVYDFYIVERFSFSFRLPVKSRCITGDTPLAISATCKYLIGSVLGLLMARTLPVYCANDV